MVNSNVKYSYALVCFMMTMMAVMACSGLPRKREYKYADRKEAMKDFREFQKELGSVRSVEREELAGMIGQWREMRESVFVYVAKDTVKQIHADARREYYQVDDSICNSFLSMVDEEKWSLNDVIYIKEHASPLVGDRDITESRDRASRFFLSLDSIVPVKNVPKEILLRDYRRMLQRASIMGFKDRSEFMGFLRSEDVYFRMFLTHLSEYNDDAVKDITKYTEKICEMVRALPCLDSETKIVYMGMRTNRRLILNMLTCIEDIRHLRCKTPELANAYFCMIIQPYISLDDVTVALLSADQKKLLYDATKEINAVIGRTKLSKEMLELLEDRLPKQLIKVYISSINE